MTTRATTKPARPTALMRFRPRNVVMDQAGGEPLGGRSEVPGHTQGAARFPWSGCGCPYRKAPWRRRRWQERLGAAVASFASVASFAVTVVTEPNIDRPPQTRPIWSYVPLAHHSSSGARPVSSIRTARPWNGSQPASSACPWSRRTIVGSIPAADRLDTSRRAVLRDRRGARSRRRAALRLP